MPKVSSPKLQKQSTHLITTNSPFSATPADSPRSTHLFVAEQLLNLSCNLSKVIVPLNPATAVEFTALSSNIKPQHLFEYIMLGSQFYKGCRNKEFSWLRCWCMRKAGVQKTWKEDAQRCENSSIWEWKEERTTGPGKWGCGKVNVDKRGKHTS